MAQPLPGTLEALSSKSSATNSKKGRKEGGGRKKERRRTRKKEREREIRKEEATKERKEQETPLLREGKELITKFWVCIRKLADFRDGGGGSRGLICGLVSRNQTLDLTLTVEISMSAPGWRSCVLPCSPKVRATAASLHPLWCYQDPCCPPSPTLVSMFLACCHPHCTERAPQLLHLPHEQPRV